MQRQDTKFILNRKALMRGCTDYFVTYLQFPIQVCFSADHVFVLPRKTWMRNRKCFPFCEFPCDIELRPRRWPSSLTFSVKVNHQAKYLGQRSIRSKVIFRSDRQTHVLLINKYANGRLLYLNHKLTGKKLSGSLKLIETSTVSIDVGLRKVLW